MKFERQTNKEIDAAGGGHHTAVIASDGAVFMAGYNGHGQLGNGGGGNLLSFQRAALPNGARAIAVACGEYFTIVVAADGTLLVAGENSQG